MLKLATACLTQFSAFVGPGEAEIAAPLKADTIEEIGPAISTGN